MMALEDARQFIINKATLASPHIPKIVVGALLLLLLMPLWVVTYLPFGDLPDHAAQINSIINIDLLKDEYKINWFTPYLFSYCLTILLSPIFGVVYSIKLILSVSLLAFPFVTYKIVKALDGDVKWALPSIVIGYSFVLFWGFYSFTISSVIGMFFILAAIHYGRKPFSWNAYALFALFSLFLFSSHALAWGFVVSFSCLVVFCFNSVNETIKKASAFFVIAPLVVLWVSGTNQEESTPAIEAGRYSEHIFNQISQFVTYVVNMFNERTAQGAHKVRLMQFFSFAIGKDSLPDYVILGAFLAFSPLLYGARITRHWKRWLPFIFTFSAFMIVPYWLFNTAYINERFSLFCFLSLLFAYEKRQLNSDSDGFFNKRNLFLFLTVGIVFTVLCSHLQTLAAFKEDDRNFKIILSRMQENKWTMALIYDNDPHPLISPAFQHYSKWYAAEKVGKVNYSFSIDPVVGHSVPLQYKYKGESRPIIDPWDPSGFKWHEHKGDMYDYFLVRNPYRVDHVFAESNNDVVLISQAGKWLLYGKRALLDSPATP
jgi:hypothetical protein